MTAAYTELVFCTHYFKDFKSCWRKKRVLRIRLNIYSLRFCFQKINSEKYHDIWVDNVELIDSYGDIIDAIIDILKVQKDERYGGQNKNFNQSHDIMVPHGIECASKHKLLPIYVLPRYDSKS